MVALRSLLILGLLALLLSVPASAAADHPWQRSRSTYGVWHSNPLHPAYPVGSAALPTFTEQWYLLQPGWGIPTINTSNFRGAYWILDMNQPLFPAPAKPADTQLMPPPQPKPE
jgi:hypothetical protein